MHSFSLEDPKNVPYIFVELVYEQNQMRFLPNYVTLEATLISVLDKIFETATSVPTIQSWVEATDFDFCDTAVDEELMTIAKRTVRANASHYFQGAVDHLSEYKAKYEYLIDGRAAEEVSRFVAADKDFEDFVEEIAKYRAIASEILRLPALKQFPMIRLDCEELKRGLAKETGNLAQVRI